MAVPKGSLLKEPLEEAGARVLEVDGMADRSYHKEDVKALKELLRRERPDLVHTEGLSGASPPNLMRRPGGVQPALRLPGTRQAAVPPRPVGQQVAE